MANWAVYIQTAKGWAVVLKGLTFDAAVKRVVRFKALNPSFDYCVDTFITERA